MVSPEPTVTALTKKNYITISKKAYRASSGKGLDSNPTSGQREKKQVAEEIPFSGGRLLETVGKIIPEGRALPENEWRTRHYWILLLTWFHAVGLSLFGVYQGFGAAQSLAEGG